MAIRACRPGQGEIVAGGDDHSIVVDDALLVFLVKEEAVGVERGVVSGERIDLTYEVVGIYSKCINMQFLRGSTFIIG